MESSKSTKTYRKQQNENTQSKNESSGLLRSLVEIVIIIMLSLFFFNFIHLADSYLKSFLHFDCVSFFSLVPLILHNLQPPERVVAHSETMGLVGERQNQPNNETI